MKKIKFLFLFLFLGVSILIGIRYIYFSPKVYENEKIIVHRGHMFSRAIEVADRMYEGIDFLTMKNDSSYAIKNGFDYKGNSAGQVSFDIGLSCISLYYAIGDEKYLTVAKKTADLLDKMLPPTGLIPNLSLIHI